MTAEEYLDKIIIEFDYVHKKSYGIAPIIEKYLSHKPNIIDKKDNDLLKEICSLIEEYDYGKLNDNSMVYYNVNDNWKEAKKHGGHFRYQIYLKNENGAAKRRIEDSDKLLKSQLEDIPVNAKFRIRGYHVALIGVFVLLLLWLIDKLNKN